MAARLLKGRLKPPTKRGSESDNSKRRDSSSRQDQHSQLMNVHRDALSESNVAVPISQPVLAQRSLSLDNSTNPTNYDANYDQISSQFHTATYGYHTSYDNPQVPAREGLATYARFQGPTGNFSIRSQASASDGRAHQDPLNQTTYFYEQYSGQSEPSMVQYADGGSVYTDPVVEKEVYDKGYQNNGLFYTNEDQNGYSEDLYGCPSETNMPLGLQDEKQGWISTNMADNRYSESAGDRAAASRTSFFQSAITEDSRINVKDFRSYSLPVYPDSGADQYDGDRAGGLDLRASYQRFDANLAYQREVDVWQDHSTNAWPSQAIPRLSFRTLLFDTQCRESNWVSKKIIRDLGAEVRMLPCSAKFVGFNGQIMAATEEASLSFKNSQGGSTYTTKFLVSSDEAVPFDMVLGADDCRKFNIISAPTFLGLVPLKQTKGERAAQAKRIAEQEAMAKEHERRRKQQEKTKASGSKGLPQGTQSKKIGEY